MVGDPIIGSIIVVDSGSPDVGELRPVVEALSDQLPIRVLELGTNVGFGAACNRGAAVTTEPIVVFLNPDTELAQGAMSSLASRFEDDATGDSHGDPSRLAVVGPTVKSPDGTVYPSARSFPSLFRSAVHAFAGVLAPGNRFSEGYLHPPGGPEWVSGTTMAVRRAAFEQVGGFDEGYFMYVEDVDLCWRLAKVGWSVAVAEDATVVHRIGGSSKVRPYSMIAAHHRSLWRFAGRSSTGLKRLALPVVAAGLIARAAMLAALQARQGRHARPPAALHQAR